jgi:hypothetical protein
MRCEPVVERLLKRAADVEAEAQRCGAEDSEEYENWRCGYGRGIIE